MLNSSLRIGSSGFSGEAADGPFRLRRIERLNLVAQPAKTTSLVGKSRGGGETVPIRIPAGPRNLGEQFLESRVHAARFLFRRPMIKLPGRGSNATDGSLREERGTTPPVAFPRIG